MSLFGDSETPTLEEPSEEPLGIIFLMRLSVLKELKLYTVFQNLSHML